MALALFSQDILFNSIAEGSDGTVSQIVNHTFSTDVKVADVVLKSFKLIHKARDNYFYEGAASITNVSIETNTVTCKVTLQLSDNNNNTLDPNKVNATILYIADCE